MKLFLNDGVCLNALRDSGSQISLLNADFVRGKQSAKQCPVKVNVECAFGQILPVAMTELQISSPDFGTNRQITINVGIIEGLKFDLILGHDIYAENRHLIDIACVKNRMKECRPNVLTTVLYNCSDENCFFHSSIATFHFTLRLST